MTSATHEIRLLSLDPTGDLDDIQCTLETHRLDSRPDYCALSYEWGDPALAVDIKVNENVFQARHNLWLFLHRLKAARNSQGKYSWDPTAKLWIDALCIDQTNVVERSAQVQLMGKIYREACGVVVWLGWADGLDPNVTLTLTKQIANDPKYGDEGYKYLSLTGPNQQIEPVDDPDATSKEIFDFVLRLCRKTYWTRRWVVQEILMAQRVLLVYGEQELPWVAVCNMFERYQYQSTLEIMAAVKALNYCDGQILAIILRTTAARIWEHQKGRKFSNPGTSLAALLHDYRSLQCESIHDRVYALKDLTEGILLDTDYSIPSLELYSRVFTIILQQDRRAFHHWRDYAADCGLTVQPLDPMDTMTHEQLNSVKPSVPLKTGIRGVVISSIDFTTFKRMINKSADCPFTETIYSEDVAQQFWLRLMGRYNQRDVMKYPGRHAKLPMHSSNFYNGRRDFLTTATIDNDQTERNTNQPAIMFCSDEHSEELGYLSITWSDAKFEDLLCHIYGNCYVVLRPNGEEFQIVGPAWMLLPQPDSGEFKTIRSPWSAVLSRICRKEWDSFLEKKDWLRNESKIIDVEVRLNVMELIRLLQINERITKVKISRSWIDEWWLKTDQEQWNDKKNTLNVGQSCQLSQSSCVPTYR